jgi:hypothetical protein
VGYGPAAKAGDVATTIAAATTIMAVFNVMELFLYEVDALSPNSPIRLGIANRKSGVPDKLFVRSERLEQVLSRYREFYGATL